jgi:predicted Fe-Mo cluster-binding NifX family protein
MKIAVASERKFVSGHFGHCEGFTVYEVDENKVLKKDFIQNPGHRPGFLPDYLKELGVNVIISGGMGDVKVNTKMHKKGLLKMSFLGTNFASAVLKELPAYPLFYMTFL